MIYSCHLPPQIYLFLHGISHLKLQGNATFLPLRFDICMTGIFAVLYGPWLQIVLYNYMCNEK